MECSLGERRDLYVTKCSLGMGRGCRYPASAQGRNAAVKEVGRMECAHGWDTWEEPMVASKVAKGDGLQLGHEEGSKVPSNWPGKKAAIEK